MAFFNSAVGVLQTLVVALGAGLGIWGAINLMEGYGNDNPGSKSQGMKQLMAGGGVALIGITLVFDKQCGRTDLRINGNRCKNSCEHAEHTGGDGHRTVAKKRQLNRFSY